jgi:hypothetical protein
MRYFIVSGLFSFGKSSHFRSYYNLSGDLIWDNHWAKNSNVHPFELLFINMTKLQIKNLVCLIHKISRQAVSRKEEAIQMEIIGKHFLHWL